MVNKIKKNLKDLKILVLGLDNAGKSTIINTFINKKEITPPTFGFRIVNTMHFGYNLAIYDIGGQSIFKKHWCNYYEKTDGVIFVIDATDTRPYTAYLKELIDLNVPICIFYNKIDLIANDIDLVDIKHFKVFKTTGFDNKEIFKGFDWLIKKCKKEYPSSRVL